MSADGNPFKEITPKPKRDAANGGAGNPKRAWTVASILGALLIVVLLCWAGAVGKLRTLESAQAAADDATAKLAGAVAENQRDKDQIGSLQAQVAQLEKEKGSRRADGQRP
jgi:hypothetical protein